MRMIFGLLKIILICLDKGHNLVAPHPTPMFHECFQAES